MKQATVPIVVCKGSNLVADATPTHIDVQPNRRQTMSTGVSRMAFVVVVVVVEVGADRLASEASGVAACLRINVSNTFSSVANLLEVSSAEERRALYSADPSMFGFLPNKSSCMRI